MFLSLFLFLYSAWTVSLCRFTSFFLAVDFFFLYYKEGFWQPQPTSLQLMNINEESFLSYLIQQKRLREASLWPRWGKCLSLKQSLWLEECRLQVTARAEGNTSHLNEHPPRRREARSQRKKKGMEEYAKHTKALTLRVYLPDARGERERQDFFHLSSEDTSSQSARQSLGPLSQNMGYERYTKDTFKSAPKRQSRFSLNLHQIWKTPLNSKAENQRIQSLPTRKSCLLQLLCHMVACLKCGHLNQIINGANIRAALGMCQVLLLMQCIQ